MINSRGLHDLVTRAEKGSLLPGEAVILRDAIDLLDDLVTTLDKIIPGGSGSRTRGYETDTTQQLKIIQSDDHGGNRP